MPASPSAVDSAARSSRETPPPLRILRAWGAGRRWLTHNTFTLSWLPERWRHPLTGYLVAVLLPGVALAVVMLLAEVLVGFAFPALLATLVVALIALTWGVGPSLAATLVGVAILAGLLLSPLLHLNETALGRSGARSRWVCTSPSGAS
jgi:hypothetical protein